MRDRTTYDEASYVKAVDSEVVLKGPDDVDIRMTPTAAEETADRLVEAALKARGQRDFEERNR